MIGDLYRNYLPTGCFNLFFYSEKDNFVKDIEGEASFYKTVAWNKNLCCCAFFALYYLIVGALKN